MLIGLDPRASAIVDGREIAARRIADHATPPARPATGLMNWRATNASRTESEPILGSVSAMPTGARRTVRYTLGGVIPSAQVDVAAQGQLTVPTAKRTHPCQVEAANAMKRGAPMTAPCTTETAVLDA
jgi:hypothetical protein